MFHRWYGVTVDCLNPHVMATFWSELLGMQPTQEMDGEGWVTLGTRDGTTPRLTFQKVAERNVGKVRLHLDIEVRDIDTAVAQVEDLGGRWSGTRYDYPEGVVLTMHDPEGHEFCMTQYYEPV